MDATLTIVIRAQARQAQQAVANTTKEMGRLATMAQALNRSGRQGFFEALSGNHLVKVGKNLQWVGRQLTYNFTLPLGLAGAALFKTTMEFEKSMTHLRKVYGSVEEDQASLRKETDALGQSFRLLSTYFGVHIAEVAEIGSAWAAAGSAGRGLAENVKATLEAMILGDMEATQATEALIAVQATWRLSTKRNVDGTSELSRALAALNIVENETGISFEGLIDVYQRAGGAARNAGFEFNELAAMAAALVPATGGAAQAGNALRTMISRLQSPTRQTVDVLSKMGITVSDPEWLGASVHDRILMMADAFGNLSTANQSFVSSIIASRWQVNRFSVLMADLNSETGYYQKALASANNDVKAQETYQRELLEVLDSHPRKWEILKNAIRNTMMDAFLPMLPAIFGVMRMFAQLAQAFSRLDPGIQKLIMFTAAAIALVGPLLIMVSAFMQLTGIIGVTLFKSLSGIVWVIGNLLKLALYPLVKGIGALAARFLGLNIVAAALKKGFFQGLIAAFRALTLLISKGLMAALGALAVALGIPLWAAAAVVAAVVAAIIILLNDDLRGAVWDTIKDIADAFWKLPGVIVDVFNTIIRVLGDAMEKVVDFLSYLNPFARHSPSLVDNVKAGVATILDEYSKLNKIGNLVGGAVTALQNFSAANAGVMRSRREKELREKANVSGVQGGNHLVDSILMLEDELPTLTRAIESQQRVVARLTHSYDQAAGKVAELDARLTSSRAALEGVTDAIDRANNRISVLANTPIKGLTALEDKIFDNQLAQNKLRMELLEFERAGVSIDKIRDKYAKLNGDLEMLRGEQASLRAAGAGSDILGVYDKQIAAIEAQKGEMAGVEEEIRSIQDALDKLSLEEQFLNLTKAINFDPLERQIDRLVNGIAEMPFEDILKGIKEQQAIIRGLEPTRKRLADQVEREERALDAATRLQDHIGAQLDAQVLKLDNLESAYSDINALIRDMESMLTSVSDINLAISSESAEKAKSFIDEMFDAGIGQDYEIFGGDTLLGREGDLADIEKFNEEMEKALADALGDLGMGDPFAWFKTKWGELQGWLRGQWVGFKTWWSDNWRRLYQEPGRWFEVGMRFLWAKIQEYGPITWGYIDQYVVQPIISAVNTVWGPLWEGLQVAWETVGQPAWDRISLVLIAFRDFAATVFGEVSAFFGRLWESVSNIWGGTGSPIFANIVGFIGHAFHVIGGILVVFQTIWGVAWNYASAVIEDAWAIIGFIFEVLVSFIKNIIFPIMEIFWKVFKSVFGIVAEVVEQGIKAVVAILMFAWDVISKTVIPIIELLAAIVAISFRLIEIAVEEAWDLVVKPIFDLIVWTIEQVLGPAINWLLDEVVEPVFDGIGEAVQYVWDNVLDPIFGDIKWVIENIVTPAVEGLLNVFESVFRGILWIVGSVFNSIGQVVETAINLLVDAFNIIAGGINAITGFLQIDIEVGKMEKVHFNPVDYDPNFEIPGFARGGAVRGAQMAIVGEGSNIYPEYIIPTDPRHRGRATSLLQEAGSRISRGDGWGIGSIGDLVGDVAGGAFDWTKDILGKGVNLLKEGAIKVLWGPIKSLAETAIQAIPTPIFKDAAGGMLGVVDDWIRGVDTAYDEAARKQIMIPNDGAGSWRVIPPYLKQRDIPFNILSTYRPGAVTRFTGQPSWHGLDRAIDLAGPTGMNNYNANDLLAINLAIYEGFKPYLKELIYGGEGAKNVFRGKDHNYSANLMREHINHVHASLARGGFVVPRTPGGSLFRIGEGLYDEKVQVVPLNGRSGGDGDGSRSFHFYGNLSFPNIQDPNDAAKLIENLEALAGSD